MDRDSEESRARLLVVDDDAQVTQTLSGVLAEGGYEVLCARCGEEALQIGQERPFAVLIADLEMPDMDGGELAQRLAERDPYIECILLSGSENLPRIIEISESAPVYTHFWKPLRDVGDVARSVARALERRSHRLEQGRLQDELRDARQELRALYTRLEPLDRVASLGSLTGALAEDLEYPLKSLLAYAQFFRAALAREEVPASLREGMERYLGEMERGVQSAYQAARSALDFARPVSEPAGPVDAREALLGALALLRRGLDAPQIQLSASLAEDAPPVSGSA